MINFSRMRLIMTFSYMAPGPRFVLIGRCVQRSWWT